MATGLHPTHRCQDAGPGPRKQACSLCPLTHAGYAQRPGDTGLQDFTGPWFCPATVSTFHYGTETVIGFHFLRPSTSHEVVACTVKLLYSYPQNHASVTNSTKFSTTDENPQGRPRDPDRWDDQAAQVCTHPALATPHIATRAGPQGTAGAASLACRCGAALPQVRFQIHVVSLYVKGIWAS